MEGPPEAMLVNSLFKEQTETMLPPSNITQRFRTYWDHCSGLRTYVTLNPSACWKESWERAKRNIKNHHFTEDGSFSWWVEKTSFSMFFHGQSKISCLYHVFCIMTIPLTEMLQEVQQLSGSWRMRWNELHRPHKVESGFHILYWPHRSHTFSACHSQTKMGNKSYRAWSKGNSNKIWHTSFRNM